MKRFLPHSLAGQMALLIGIALFLAQLVNFALLLNERQKLNLAQNEGPAIARFVVAAGDPGRFVRNGTGVRESARPRRPGRFSRDAASLVAAGAARSEGAERRLRQALAAAGIAVAEVRAAAVELPAPVRPNRTARHRAEVQILILSARLGDGEWLNGRFLVPRRDPYLALRLGLSTLLLYLIVLGATLLIARRLARPLRELTEAAERFQGKDDAVALEPTGPNDLRRAITAFNAMSRRVVGLLDEKDRMLGAIGHDLRTPLASLRIRAESMEPEEERAKMAATIAEMTAMLEDILVLARSGRSREEARPMDVAALADALAEEYGELGRDVAFATSERQVLDVQPTLLRRALRNLIDNALQYAGSAELSVHQREGNIEIAVEDRGPGLPPEELERVLEPFHRMEASRSRETGGSGLGLTIARAVAESHGGSLRLANREGGGLSARLILPRRRSDNRSASPPPSRRRKEGR